MYFGCRNYEIYSGGNVSYPALATNPKKDHRGKLRSFTTFIKDAYAPIRNGVSEYLDYQYKDNQHIFEGTRYLLTIDASLEGKECGDWWFPKCDGEVTYMLIGDKKLEQTVSFAAVISNLNLNEKNLEAKKFLMSDHF